MRCTPKFALALALSAPTLAAQGLTHSGGTLGSSLSYTVTGSPGVIYALLPSFSTGPTPLALLDPADPRLLGVGIELAGLWSVGVLLGGSAQVNYGLPVAAAANGLALHAQAVEVIVAPSFFAGITPRVSTTLGLPGESAKVIGVPVVDRLGHTATSLLDGRVLLAGGGDYTDLQAPQLTDQLETYDAQTESFTPLIGSLSKARTAHVAVRLADGRVLIIGGADLTASGTVEVDLYDPSTNAVTSAASMSTARAVPSAVLLSDGRVFVSGGAGFYDPADLAASLGSATDKTELYDPATNSWTAGPDLPKPRAAHGASVLPDGRVLLSGGVEVTLIFGLPVPAITNDCRLYDPITNSLAPAAAFVGQSGLHAQLTRSDGRAYIVGGGDLDIASFNLTPLSQVQSYDASSNSWTTHSSLTVPRGYIGLFEAKGRLWAVGGVQSVDVALATFTPSVAIESLGDPLLGWTQHGDILHGRDLSISALSNGGERILTTGTIAPTASGGVVNAEAFYLP